MMKHLLLLIVLVLNQPVFTQTWTDTKIIWQEINASYKFDKKQKIDTVFESALFYQLDIVALKSILSTVPKWANSHPINKEDNYNSTVLQMPLPDGRMQEFHVLEAPVMHPNLAKKFPQLKSYKGKGLTDPRSTLYFDISDQGIHGTIYSGKNDPVFIEPVPSEKNNLYKIYFKNDSQKNNDWDCFVPENKLTRDKAKNNTFNKSNFCGLRTFRIAIACSGEYAQFHGGTKELALAAIHTTITRLNGIFERDLSVFLQIVPNNDLLIFLNPYSDPFPNTVGWNMLEKNQEICNEIIGENNYDIGHAFTTQGGGLAKLRSVCQSGLKAQGATGYAVPEGDLFDIDYVAHEIGHQFGANHTHNNNCNRHTPTAIEPGSGSSIMSYAGICSPNIQSTSDAYFHAINISEINDFLNDELCGDNNSTNNDLMADAGNDYFIPKSTPFKLTGSVVTNISEENILYNWEQADNQITVMPPTGQNNLGPLFRSYTPSSDPFRFFPKLSTLVRNEQTLWEVLPERERELNFIFSVRGNQIEGSCGDFDKMKVQVNGSAGPFKIISLLAGHWSGGVEKEIMWSVANTDKSPINCNKVDILLSEDGGFTYPYILAANVPNDGSHKIIVPNIKTEEARVMVKSVDNIFFDISDQNIIISRADDFWVELEINHLKCHGGVSGGIAAKPVGGVGNYQYSWSNGETSSIINSLSAGNYSVTITSENLTTFANAVINEPDPIQIDFVLGTNYYPPQYKLTAFTSGGAGGFSYRWGNDSINKSIEILSSGEYSLTVTDTNGCSFSKNYYVHKSDLIEENENDEFPELSDTFSVNDIQLYPNPSNGFLQIDFFQINQGGPELIVCDMMGREVGQKILLSRKEGWRSEKIDVSGLNTGCYVLQIREGTSRKIKKFTKI